MKKEPLRIISPNFELLGEIDDYESLQFIRRFYTVGEFELHVCMDKNNTDALAKDNLILLGSHFDKVGIIMYRENQPDESGVDELIIKGPTLKGVMSRRLIVPPTNGNGYDSQSGSQETILKAFVNNNVVNPTDANRKIPQVVIATDQKRGKQDAWRSRFENLADKLGEIGQYASLGWDVALDVEHNAWAFDVLQGRDLTADQSTLPPVIFSTDFDNIITPHFVQSSMGSANLGYAGGQGEDADRLIQEVGNASGLERIESFLDCSNAENTTELLTLGSQKLNELKETKTFEFSIIPDNTFIYETDYNLGDFVTAMSRKWNITMNAQIIEIKEIYEVDGIKLEVTFGTNIPNILTKIKSLKSNNVEVPTKISSFTNDKNYASESQLPTAVSQLKNDSSFDTTTGAQQKADTAESNAKTYTDNNVASSLKEAKSYADTGDSNTLNSAKTYTDNKTASLVNSAPATLDTLNELAQALGDDPNFAATMSNIIGSKETPQGAQQKADSALSSAKAYADSIKPITLPANGGTADKATITHRLYRHDPETEDLYYIAPWWTGNANGWRIGAYNINSDEQTNIHKVSVDRADDSDMLDGKHASNFINYDTSRPNNVDFNTYVATGVWTIGSIGANIPNDGNASWGTLMVTVSADVVNQFVLGISSQLYYRSKTGGGGWTQWRQIASIDQIPTSLPANGGNANTIGNVDISRLVFGDNNTKTKSVSNPGNNILPSGFYNVPQNSASGMPFNTWWHLIVNCHTGSNPDNQYNPYNFQLAQGFWDDTIYYRTISPGGSNTWRKLVNTEQVIKTIASSTEPSLNTGDWWYKTS